MVVVEVILLLQQEIMVVQVAEVEVIQQEIQAVLQLVDKDITVAMVVLMVLLGLMVVVVAVQEL
jgi:hypothetical protein